MNPKERLIAALERRKPDRLPATTHHVMPYYLDTRMNGMSSDGFFDYFGLDPVTWIIAYKPADNGTDYYDPTHEHPGFLEARRVVSDRWRIEQERLDGHEYDTTRYRIVTPGGTLTTILQGNSQTAWVAEPLIKEPSDIDIIAAYVTHPLCDVGTVNRRADDYGSRGLVRGHIPCFDLFGQPGCWQDACCLAGTERMIMATYDDPGWVHSLLGILRDRKLSHIRSMKGARYDIIELGGGDASTTVISPGIFDRFVAPYDSALIAAAHEAGQRIVYHTCGGMMPILEHIADMGPDAMETFTPPGMGGDVDLAEAKRRIGGRVCMIGGFDQFHFFTGVTPEETRREVRRCFEAAGEGGGYIISPSDHFFDADTGLVRAFADEASRCVY
jgi:hypothetical protein